MVLYNNIKKFIIEEDYKKQTMEYLKKIITSICILHLI